MPSTAVSEAEEALRKRCDEIRALEGEPSVKPEPEKLPDVKQLMSNQARLVEEHKQSVLLWEGLLKKKGEQMVIVMRREEVVVKKLREKVVEAELKVQFLLEELQRKETEDDGYPKTGGRRLSGETHKRLLELQEKQNKLATRLEDIHSWRISTVTSSSEPSWARWEREQAKLGNPTPEDDLPIVSSATDFTLQIKMLELSKLSRQICEFTKDALTAVKHEIIPLTRWFREEFLKIIKKIRQNCIPQQVESFSPSLLKEEPRVMFKHIPATTTTQPHLPEIFDEPKLFIDKSVSTDPGMFSSKPPITRIELVEKNIYKPGTNAAGEYMKRSTAEYNERYSQLLQSVGDYCFVIDDLLRRKTEKEETITIQSIQSCLQFCIHHLKQPVVVTETVIPTIAVAIEPHCEVEKEKEDSNVSIAVPELLDELTIPTPLQKKVSVMLSGSTANKLISAAGFRKNNKSFSNGKNNTSQSDIYDSTIVIPTSDIATLSAVEHSKADWSNYNNESIIDVDESDNGSEQPPPSPSEIKLMDTEGDVLGGVVIQEVPEVLQNFREALLHLAMKSNASGNRIQSLQDSLIWCNEIYKNCSDSLKNVLRDKLSTGKFVADMITKSTWTGPLPTSKRTVSEKAASPIPEISGPVLYRFTDPVATQEMIVDPEWTYYQPQGILPPVLKKSCREGGKKPKSRGTVVPRPPKKSSKNNSSRVSSKELPSSNIITRILRTHVGSPPTPPDNYISAPIRQPHREKTSAFLPSLNTQAARLRSSRDAVN